MRLTRILGTALAAATALALAACGSDSGPGTGATASGDGFPMTITHALGTTPIDKKPERIATVAWANHEVPLALGIVPVGMTKVTWGDDDGDGILPWVEDKLADLNADTPVLFDETDGIPFEQVADTDPDVILAAYSGLTKGDYETLSKIAPVVAFPEVAWGTSWEDMVTMNSKAIGMADQGEKLIEDTRAMVAESLAKFPQLKDKTVMFSYIDPADTSQVGFYTTHDTRPGFLLSVGIASPKLVVDRSAQVKTFYETISAEEADQFEDVDVLVSYGQADGSTLAAFQADPLLSKIPAIARGSVAILQDSTPLSASANPSPLSIPWGIDDYFALLAAAADKVG